MASRWRTMGAKGARALALWCALLVTSARASAYTVDCNHEYTDCDTELSKYITITEECVRVTSMTRINSRHRMPHDNEQCGNRLSSSKGDCFGSFLKRYSSKMVMIRSCCIRYNSDIFNIAATAIHREGQLEINSTLTNMASSRSHGSY